MTLLASDILCLVPSTTAPPKQASFLAQALGATLHVLPLPSTSGLPLDTDGLEALVHNLHGADSGQHPITIPDLDEPRSEDIIQYADEASIDLLVVAPATPQAPLDDASVASLLEHLNLPFFFGGHAEEPPSIHRIVVPTDFSAHSLDALHNATALAHLYDAPIDVLHVIDSMPYVALTRTDRLSIGPSSLTEHRGHRQVRAFLREGHVSPEIAHSHVAYGDPAQQITAFAKGDEDALLVMSSHGTANQPQRPLGSVAENVLGQTTGPTFLLRAFGPSLLEKPFGSSSPDTSVPRDDRP